MKRPETSWFSRFHQMNENLTLAQADVFQFAKSGHNLHVTGQAGTGKLRVVNAIRDDCQQRGFASICNLFEWNCLSSV